MYTGLGLKIKQLNNLIAKKMCSFLVDGEYPNISQSAFLIIDFLYENQNRDIKQTDVEKTLAITGATASKILLLLEQKGMIIRQNSKEDARCKIVKLTAYGKRLREHNIVKVNELESFLNDVLTEEEFEMFDRIYNKLRDKLSD